MKHFLRDCKPGFLANKLPGGDFQPTICPKSDKSSKLLSFSKRFFSIASVAVKSSYKTFIIFEMDHLTFFSPPPLFPFLLFHFDLRIFLYKTQSHHEDRYQFLISGYFLYCSCLVIMAPFQTQKKREFDCHKM